MIWVIANSIEEDGSFPTYKHYKQAFRDGEIDIFCASQNDDFSFLNHDDVVLMRTRDENIVHGVRERQKVIGFKSTIESDRTNFLTHDKVAVKKLLQQHGIPQPKTVEVEDIVDGARYFVKPRYGENSIGIDNDSLCHSLQQVVMKCESLANFGVEPMIEEYVDGFDVTTSVIHIKDTGELRTDTIRELLQSAPFQTYEYKERFIYDPYQPYDSVAYDNTIVNDMAKRVFRIVGAEHYMRIDFRMVNDMPFVLDVNMVPGLAPNGYMSKCLREHGVHYHDFIRMVVDSAF